MGENHTPDGEHPIIRDKRKIDPETGLPRAGSEAHPDVSAAGATGDLTVEDILAAAGPSRGDESSASAAFEVPSAPRGESASAGGTPPNPGAGSGASAGTELLGDLKRVTAEYANYRKRTEANREVERERSMVVAAGALIPVLDDVDRAEKHGDLAEGSSFAAIAGKLRTVARQLGLVPFGEAGEAFDPARHQAIFQKPDPEVTIDTVAEVVESGYMLGSQLVRVAKVVVATPEERTEDSAEGGEADA